MKELDRTTEAIVPINEMWRKLNANMRQYVPLRANMWQDCSMTAVQRKTAFVEPSCHDGLNLRCLDQCHGVRSHGTSSSQSWRKRIVIQQSEFIHERQRL